MVYSSWSDSRNYSMPSYNLVQMCNVNESEKTEALNFEPSSDRFCLFSVKFSPTKQEILAGSSDCCVYIYDLEKKMVSSKVQGHSGDINSVCYATPNSDQIFYSASDDMFCKIWDRRTFGKSLNSEGVLIGHLEGITHIDSKGDGKHLITNSKDQSIKLWDIRKMQCGKAPLQKINKCPWDYRWGEASAPPTLKQIFGGVLSHPKDMSLMTYRSHKVFRTLIRCYFSPLSTGQKFIYSGSTDVYDVLTGNVVQQLKGHLQLVRDVAWHPELPQIVTTSWDGALKCWSHKEQIPSGDLTSISKEECTNENECK